MRCVLKQKSNHRHVFFGLLLFLFPGSLLAADGSAGLDIQWLHDFDVTLLHNDNIGQASVSRDEIDATSVSAGYGLLSNIEIDNDRAITLKAFIEGRHVDDVSDLSSTTVGAQFIYRWQPSRGFLQPFYQFNASIQKDSYGAGQRDSTVARAQFFATRRLTDKLTAVGGLEHFSQDAKDAVFDLDHNRIFINLDYQISEASNAYSTYSFRKGEVASLAQSVSCDGTSTPGIPGLIAASNARSSDQAFGREFCGSWVSYKLQSDTHVVSFGINRAVGLASAVDVSIQRVESRSSSNIRYTSNIIAASYLLRL